MLDPLRNSEKSDVTSIGDGQSKLKILKEERYRPVFITRNKVMKDVLHMVEQVAGTDASVLLTGDSGTGKEVIAQHIHYLSGRSDQPFVTVNCGAIPHDLVESELFGHQKGAFTGALATKIGQFEQADKGTLFLDEIGDMPLDMQVKLLRAVETQSFRRIGGTKEVKVDVRLIAATNNDLPTAIKNNEFREDLFYRLSVMELHLPPLRERKDDIPVLIEHFMELFTNKYDLSSKVLSNECLDQLLAYEWPGNVRELRNVMERLVILCPDDYIRASHIPPRVQKALRPMQMDKFGEGALENDKGLKIPFGTSIEEAQEMMVIHTLAQVDNNISEAARILGVSRKTVHNKLNKMNNPHKSNM